MDTGVHQGTHEPCVLVAGEERRAREIARESACEGIWVEELLWEEMCVLRVPGFHILISLILCMHLQNVSHFEIVALLLAHYLVWEVLHPWSI